jgi:hypothetical protein
MGDMPFETDARDDRPEAPKVLRSGCAEPGCGVMPSVAVYKHANGGAACISHAVDRGPKHRAAALAGESTRRKRIRFMAPGTPAPDWSTPKAIRAWLEDRAGRIERGELDARAVPSELAKIAKSTHDTEAIERLDSLEALIRQRMTGET